MATDTDTDEDATGARPPTAGPDAVSYDRYDREWTKEGLVIRDGEREAEWVQSSRPVSLETMR